MNYNGTGSVDVPAGTSVYGYFTGGSTFDVGNSFVVFTPTAAGGCTVRTVAAPPAVQNSVLTGDAGVAGVQALAATSEPANRRVVRLASVAARTLTRADIANAEVTVISSGDPRYLGMTNTDVQGRISLAGVLPGGINVMVRCHGVLLARGSAVFEGGVLNQAQLLQIKLVSPEVESRPGSAPL